MYVSRSKIAPGTMPVHPWNSGQSAILGTKPQHRRTRWHFTEPPTPLLQRPSEFHSKENVRLGSARAPLLSIGWRPCPDIVRKKTDATDKLNAYKCDEIAHKCAWYAHLMTLTGRSRRKLLCLTVSRIQNNRSNPVQRIQIN